MISQSIFIRPSVRVIKKQYSLNLLRHLGAMIQMETAIQTALPLSLLVITKKLLTPHLPRAILCAQKRTYVPLDSAERTEDDARRVPGKLW